MDSDQQIRPIQMETAKIPFQIRVTNVYEIRMGSPYKHCNIELVGFDKIKLPIGGWQDKYAWSGDFKKLVLVRWNFINNAPGFHLLLIDTETGQTTESPRSFGLPNDISFAGEKIKVNKFLYSKEKSKLNNLCCSDEEEFDFSK